MYRRLGGPQGRSRLEHKISPPTGFDPGIVQPVVGRCTDCAIPAHFVLSCTLFKRIATSWTVSGSNSGGDEILRTRSDRTRGPPGLLYNAFPGVKRPEHSVDHLSPFNAYVKERVELYLCSPFGPSWPV
jgi:hypothetical protein